MSRTPNQNKALKWYIEIYNLKPQLSAHPMYRFTDSSGAEKVVNILNIVSEWNRMRKEKEKTR